MNSLIRNYVLATVLPIAVVIAVTLFISEEILDSFLVIISAGVCFPIIMMGLYMYMEGSGQRWINGVDWTKLTSEEIRNAVSYWGFYMMVGTFVLLVSINILLSHMIIAFILIAVSVAIMIFPVAKIHPGKNLGPMRKYTAKTKALIYAVVLALALLILFGLGFMNSDSSTVNVTMGDSEFSVTAPMFDETFAYSEIDELGYDPHFDKGSRVAGYGTPTISSGKFRNDVFGTYRLASYTQIDPCIWVKVDGTYYAFNQSTDEATHEIYLQLRIKTGL